ncbi:uncharacterized protein LOC133358774 [Lethenteron reissneri]|uniref:Tumor necrosis factor receptor 10B-like protein n=1 Tax=Lethenteron reissneri TaxID=7753 RepID=A0A650E806_LETRI|nr:uncharacterized protein LOC133358774 [Lethenteron reissneri]QGT41386.1 tumor necrosis factor receptor 10B-like protein [Lethenteron reissneri]
MQGGAWARRRAVVSLALGIVFFTRLVSCQACSAEFYKTSNNICCKLCRAGTYKAVDCTENGKDAFCLLCPEGLYMETENHATSCNPCKKCGKDETIKTPCTIASNTQCRCKEGLQWNPETRTCSMTEPGAIVKPVTHLAVFILILLLIWIARYMWKFFKNLKQTWERKDQLPMFRPQSDELEMLITNVKAEQDGPAFFLLKNKKRDLKLWLRVNPEHLLEHLDSNNLMSRDFYKRATALPPEERIDAVLTHFMMGGEHQCRVLLRALFDVRKTYADVWNWLMDTDRKVKLIIVEGQSLRAIRMKKLELKQWLSSNPSHLVDKLKKYGFLTAYKAPSFTNSEECTLNVLNHFIDRGDKGCEKLLFALQAVHVHYAHLHTWLRSLGFFMEILNNSPLFIMQRSDAELSNTLQKCLPKLINILQSDVKFLVRHLLQQNLITKETEATLLGEATEMKKSVTLQDVVKKHPRCASKLWEIVWGLRDSHPQLTEFCLQL